MDRMYTLYLDLDNEIIEQLYELINYRKIDKQIDRQFDGQIDDQIKKN